jgi:4-carboxymuconolactone decarboxylase
MNQDLYDLGLATRRKVLGDAYVDASLAAVTDFSRDIQDYVTQYCWVHVRGALNKGVTRDQIREVLMQAAFYCGGPAALESFRLAAEVFAQLEAEASE